MPNFGQVHSGGSGHPPPLAHQALLYGSDEEFLAVTSVCARDGVRAGDPVLVVAGQRACDLLREALGRDAKNVDFHLATGWYLHPPRTLAALHDYVSQRDGRRVRIIGEPVWAGRSAREIREWQRYESVVNVAFAGMRAEIICPYDSRVLPSAVLAGARRAHPLISGTPGANPDYVDPHEAALDSAPLAEPPAGVVQMPFAIGELRSLRELAGRFAREAGLARSRVPGFILAIAEIAGNAVEHGAGHGLARLWAVDGEVVCEISDPAGRLPVAFPGYLPPQPYGERGYGLWVARQLCDLMEVRTAGGASLVRLHMSLA